MRHIHLNQHIKHGGDAVYGVIKLVNSVEFKIGDELSRGRVTGLCQDASWHVTVTKANKRTRL